MNTSNPDSKLGCRPNSVLSLRLSRLHEDGRERKKDNFPTINANSFLEQRILFLIKARRHYWKLVVPYLLKIDLIQIQGLQVGELNLQTKMLYISIK